MTPEFAAKTLPGVVDALAVETGGRGCRFLFVVLRPGHVLDDAQRTEIHRLTAGGHTPDAVYAVADLPRSAEGQPLREAVRRLLTGEAAASVAAREGVANPESLGYFAFLFNNL